MRIEPLSSQTFPDFENLFTAKGACGGCWCMYWRLENKEFEANKGNNNKRLMRNLVNNSDIPGVLGYVKDEAIAWCSISPRNEYPRLKKSRILKPVDDLDVWSITCLFIKKEYRLKGYSTEIITRAAKYAIEHGAKIIEAYPYDKKDKKSPDPFIWTGITSSYLKAGFVEVARRSPLRPIMRYFRP